MNVLFASDQEARERALDPSQSFIVQAPAGSGKTELLIQRFLKLLNQVQKPEEILSITFTKKAANEMRSRVIHALQSALLPSPQKTHAKKTWQLAKDVLKRDRELHWHLIQNPNQLRIQTIDSLCAYLTKQLPLLSHFGAQPAMADNPKELYSQAVQEVLLHVEEKVEWAVDIANLLLHLDNNLNHLHDLLVSLLAKRDQWLPYIHFDWQDNLIRESLEKNLQGVIHDAITHVQQLFPKILLNELLEIACYTNILNTPSLPFDKTSWVNIAKLLLTKKSESHYDFRKRPDEKIGFISLKNLKNKKEENVHASFRKRYVELVQALTAHDDLRLALTELFFLPEPTYQDGQWAILRSLLHVLKILTAQLRLTFQAHGKIDFIENTQAALLALGTDDQPTDLALSLDYQIKHILVDEFQDTAYTQYHLLEKLIMGWQDNDGRTLFVVGDPMQSIYRFREAEVGLYIRMREQGIGGIPLIPLTLSVNFRSTDSIVKWNNHLFSDIFPKSNHIAKGAVSYSPSLSLSTDETKTSTDVKIMGFVNPSEDDQAKNIIHTITQLQEQFPQEKIAILVRSRNQLTTLIPALKKAKVIFQALDIDALLSKQSIQDLLSLSSALLQPANRIAWLAILRAPWCGLSLADLLLIAGNHTESIIWEKLQTIDEVKELSPDGRARLTRVLPILKLALDERARYPLRRWIEKTWVLLGGPATLQNELEMQDADAFFALLEHCQRESAHVALDQIKQKMEDLFATPQYDDRAVQIMTIHNAKGLEFDTVILPHLERNSPHADLTLLSWMEQPLTNHKHALLLAPIPGIEGKDALYAYIKRQQKIKTDYESDRIFYVATTRAKKRLYLFFNISQKEEGDLKFSSRSFLGKIEKSVRSGKNTLLHANANEVSAKPETAESKPFYRFKNDWQNPIQLPQGNPLAIYHSLANFKLKNRQPAIIGMIIHRLFQNVTELGFDWWENESEEQQFAYLICQLRFHFIEKNELEKSASLIFNMVKNVLKDDRGRWILSRHKEANSEFALTSIIDGHIENLIIDRTFIDDQEIRWIIDYKTTAFKHLDLAVFLKNEQEKYLHQMQKYCQAMQTKDHRPIKIGLYFPNLLAWKEWCFDEIG